MAMSEQGTAWTAVVQALVAEGVEYIFGVPGNTRHLLEDLDKHSAIEFVLMRHESSAVAAAAAYARLRGRPGIVFSNPGPGISQLATNLLEATSASLPVIALANGVASAIDGKGAFQELDAVALMRPVTKWALRVDRPDRLPWIMQRAFHRAVNGRPGAVFIEIPSDMALAPQTLEPYQRSAGRLRSRAQTADIAAAAARIARAERPVLLCGSGAVASAAFEPVRQLAETWSIPIVASPGGRGIYPEEGPMFLGLSGLYFTAAGKQWFAETDLVISIGSRLEAFTTDNWRIIPEQADYIQIDIDVDVIGMNYRPEIALIGDAASVLDDLMQAMPAVDKKILGRREALIASLRQPVLDKAQRDGEDRSIPIRPPAVLAKAMQVFGKDTILVKENGGTDLWCYYWPYYRVIDTGHCVAMGEQTNMGFGITGTIGAKLAMPDKNVICFAGDGAMQMAMYEIATAAERKLGITWVIFNNHALGWVQYTQVLRQQPLTGTRFDVAPDFTAIAEAQSCHGIKVTDPAALEDALRSALAANQQGVPAVIDVEIAVHDYSEHFMEVHKRNIGFQAD